MNHWLKRQKERAAIASTKGSIVLAVDNQEMIKVTPEGFYVEGRFVTKDVDIYDAFVRFLKKVQP